MRQLTFLVLGAAVPQAFVHGAPTAGVLVCFALALLFADIAYRARLERDRHS